VPKSCPGRVATHEWKRMTFALLLMLTQTFGAPIVRDGAPGQVIHVHPGDNLNSVMENAAAGDTLMLADGVYTLDDGRTLSINKHLTIAAQTAGQVVIDGSGVQVFCVSGVAVTFKGLNITGGDGTYAPNLGKYVGGAAYIKDGAQVLFDSCNIYSNKAGYGAGIFIANSNPPSLKVDFQNCNIHSNHAIFDGGGVQIDVCKTCGDSVTFKSCSIHDNDVYQGPGYDGHGGGIYVDEDSGSPLLDHMSSVQNNKPDNCYGFWSSPACFGKNRTSLLMMKAK